MKIMYISLILSIYSFAGWQTRGFNEPYDQAKSDSITTVGKINVDKLKRLYDEQKNVLLDSLVAIRDSGSNVPIPVAPVKSVVYKTKQVIKYVPRYDTVVIKYSLWSTRGAHVTIDTIIKKGKTK